MTVKSLVMLAVCVRKMKILDLEMDILTNNEYVKGDTDWLKYVDCHILSTDSNSGGGRRGGGVPWILINTLSFGRCVAFG
jgi:hypothetical protein